MHMTTHQCLFCASIANSTLHRNVYQPSLYEHVWGGFCPIQLLQIPTGESTYSVLWLIALISNWHCHPCVRTFVRSAFLRIVMAQAIHPVSRNFQTETTCFWTRIQVAWPRWKSSFLPMRALSLAVWLLWCVWLQVLSVSCECSVRLFLNVSLNLLFY